MKPTETKSPSHYETYKGWSVAVQVSAHMSRIDTERKEGAYIPRIIVTEHIGTDFKDKEVPDGHSYPTPEECIAQGILTAREYIDRKTEKVAA
ncbi:Hypothetical protein mma_2471 [Janthinobacterium sp. Marseille]|nr:hypothetical protein [Janthinobacterium sp. Marseille]ABR91110.1 Hypothetical protein mma_2471 [Janthinobacterium sp. Marseille]